MTTQATPIVPPKQRLQNVIWSLDRPLMGNPIALNVAAHTVAQAVSELTGCPFVVMPALDRDDIRRMCNEYI